MNVEVNDLTDSRIASLLAEGEIDMYKVIMSRYEAKLLRYAMFLVRDYDMALLAVSKTFEKAYGNIREYKVETSFKSWVFRILRNESLLIIKKNKHRLAIFSNDFFERYSADKSIDSNFLRTNIKTCLNKLSINQQEILALFYFENLKYEEISYVLHIPLLSVDVKIGAAKLRLRKLCEKSGVDYE